MEQPIQGLTVHPVLFHHTRVMLGKSIEKRLDVRFGMPRRHNEPDATALHGHRWEHPGRSAKPTLTEGLQQIVRHLEEGHRE